MTVRFLVSFIAIFVFANMAIYHLILSASSELNSEDVEEVRDNLVEVRLALQKGDLTEALQHLNNAEEQLLLFAGNVTASSRSTMDVNSTIPNEITN